MPPSDRNWRRIIALSGLPLLLLGCAAGFDAAAYKNAVDLKYETLALIDKGGGRYAAHRSQAEALTTRLDAAYVESAKIANNQAAEAQWKTIVDPGGNSAGAFLSTWKNRGAVSSAYRAEKKRIVTRHFDYVICLESSKQTAGSCVNPGAPAEAVQAEAEAKPARMPTPKPKPAEDEPPAAPAQQAPPNSRS